MTSHNLTIRVPAERLAELKARAARERISLAALLLAPFGITPAPEGRRPKTAAGAVPAERPRRQRRRQ